MIPFRSKAAAALVIALASLVLPLFAFSRGQASPPPPDDRFRWVEEVEALFPREIPNQLSRPLPSARQPTIALPDLGLVVDFNHYPSSAEVVTTVHQLEATYPSLVEVYEIGQSWQGRPIMALRITAEAVGDPDGKPALYADGQHHAREAIGAQILLYTAQYLLTRYGTDSLVTHLLDTRAVYLVPSVNPDGNDIWLTADQSQRKTANPSASDDDGDGLFDEDPPEGAGYGTYDVYIYEFDPAWADAHSDDPFAAGWQDHYLGRAYRGVFDSEGHEIIQENNDSDGRVNEDPYGGVDANRNYDSHCRLADANPTSWAYRGPEPFSEPETRAVRDFVQTRPNIATALTYHSGADILLYPWGWSAEAQLPGALWYELLARKGTQLTEANGFRGAPHTWVARGFYVAPGNTMDWLYESHGIYTWAPEAYGASSIAFTERITATGVFTVGLSVGLGLNSLPEDIPRVADRWNRWNLYLLAATPNIGLSRVDVGDSMLTVTVANDGLLPLDAEVDVETKQGTYSTTMDGLSTAERAWMAPLLPALRTQTMTITLTASSEVGTATGPMQVEVVKLEIREGDVRVVEGRLEPFAELSVLFGGWFASRVWNTPGEDHLGPPLLFEGFAPLVGRSG